jgi:putative two-component system response regulator
MGAVAVTLTVRSLAKRLNWLDAERRRAAEKVARLAALVDASSEAIMSSDERGVITTCNPAAEKLYGYSEMEIIGQPASVLSPPERRLEQRRLMEAAKRGDTIIECDTQRQRKDGSLIEVSVMLSRIMESGAFRGYCAVTRDITGRVRSRDQLEETVRDRTYELFRSRAETLKSLALAAEYRDYDTAEHTERVGERAARLTARLGLPAGSVELIGQAAPLHDVGKIGIPDHILLKPLALTPEEFGVMKEHTILGSKLLARSDNEVLQLGESIALTHHERWDGNGYPAGLSGEKIPITGRIVAVVDAFDAMTRDRPYRSARSIDHALAEVARCSGTQFDPRVAAAFLELQHQDADRAG